jgi:hypothetical protein
MVHERRRSHGSPSDFLAVEISAVIEPRLGQISREQSLTITHAQGAMSINRIPVSIADEINR